MQARQNVQKNIKTIQQHNLLLQARQKIFLCIFRESQVKTEGCRDVADDVQDVGKHEKIRKNMKR